MFNKEEYSKIIEKSLIEKGFLSKPSFEEKLQKIINESFYMLPKKIDKFED